MESAYDRILKTLKDKPAKSKRFVKFSSHKFQPHDIKLRKCVRCNRLDGHIRVHGLNYCRECFREVATDLGFRKYGAEA